MNLVRRIVEILIERLVASVSTMFASRLDTLAALEHAEQQDELEVRARRFEDEGKPHLAASLRSRAVEISTENPGATGHNVIGQLQHQHTELDPPRISQTPTEEAGHPASLGGSVTKNRRPTKRPSCRKTNTN